MELQRRYGSMNDVAEQYSERYGGSIRSTMKLLTRIRYEAQTTVQFGTFDRLCAMAGTHVDLVYAEPREVFVHDGP